VGERGRILMRKGKSSAASLGRRAPLVGSDVVGSEKMADPRGVGGKAPASVGVWPFSSSPIPPAGTRTADRTRHRTSRPRL
jgi:hypothetical protein